MTARGAHSGEINGDFVDRFTLAHAAGGAALGLMRTSFPTALVVAVGWELVERPLKDAYPALFPHETQDTLPNAVGDVLAVLGGWWLVSRGR